MEKDIQEQVEEFESYPTPPSLDYMSSWLRQALTTAEQRGYRKGWDAAMVSVPNPNYSQEEIQKAEQRGAEKERERMREEIITITKNFTTSSLLGNKKVMYVEDVLEALNPSSEEKI